MSDDTRPVLVSACLLGVRCRYDGRAAEVASVAEATAGRRRIPVCPEELGGLGTPRPPAALSGGDGHDVLDGRARVITHEGRDVTDGFVAGSRRVLAIAVSSGACEAILKARSPSCGCGTVHGDGELRPGDGVTTAALVRAGVHVRSVG